MFSFIHISDLHIGRKLNSYDLLEDQKYALGQIVRFVEDLRPDAVLIAGDVFDRINPSEEATALLGSFLEELQAGPAEVFVIAGNHDPVEKLSFLSGVVDKAGLHIVTAFHGVLEKRAVGDADIYMLPYIRTVDVRPFFPEEEIASVGDAVRLALSTATLDRGRTNVLIAHQSVLGAVNGGSEDVVIGGESPISSSLFSDFDYVALGHLHIPQQVSRQTIRYSGSPLKYSASEAHTPKGMVLADIRGKGDVRLETVPLVPRRDLRVLRGRVEDLISAGLDDAESRDDYIIAELSDQPGQALSEFYKVYPNTMSVSVRSRNRPSGAHGAVTPDPLGNMGQMDLFTEFFRSVTGKELTGYQTDILRDCIETGGEAE